MDSERDNLLRRLTVVLQEGRAASIDDLLEGLHATDLLDLVRELDEDDRHLLYCSLDLRTAADLLGEMSPEEQSDFLHQVGNDRAFRILEEMPSDEAADFLGDLPRDDAEGLLKMMPPAEAEGVEELLEYGEQTAGGIMATEFIAINRKLSAQKVIDQLRRTAPEAEIAYYLYVVDDENRLAGVISLRDLLVSPPDMLVEDFMPDRVISVSADVDQEEVARLTARYDLLAVPVVDSNQRLVGVVTIDDVVDIISEEASEDIYRLAGTQDEREIVDPLKLAAKRFPWILIGLVGELLNGRVIKGFSPSLSEVIAVSFFIPVIMAAGGNVGTQSLASMIRAIALGSLTIRQIPAIIGRETIVGLLLGLASGVLVGLVAQIWLGQWQLGLVIGLSMSVTLALASVMGTTIPLAFRWAGRDPAFASGPFITTLNDIISIFIYLILASLLITRF